MNPYIKSHLQLARLPAEVAPLPPATPHEAGRSKVLKQVKSLHIQRNLLLANKNSERFIGHHPPHTDDPFGGVLRHLRTEQGVEACEVASKACISVWQLYELETGKDTLFYTPGLRLKAAQRVAALLGSDWSDISEGRVIANVKPAPTAQLHLLKTTRTEQHASPSQIRHAGAFEPAPSAHQGSAPLSAALFLRVADVHSC